jgi:hypothetical protein
VVLEVELQLVMLDVEQVIDLFAKLHLHSFIFGVDPNLQQSVFLALGEDHAYHLRRLKGLPDTGKEQRLPLPIEESVLVLLVGEPNPAAPVLPLLN